MAWAVQHSGSAAAEGMLLSGHIALQAMQQLSYMKGQQAQNRGLRASAAKALHWPDGHVMYAVALAAAAHPACSYA